MIRTILVVFLAIVVAAGSVGCEAAKVFVLPFTLIKKLFNLIFFFARTQPAPGAPAGRDLVLAVGAGEVDEEKLVASARRRGWEVRVVRLRATLEQARERAAQLVGTLRGSFLGSGPLADFNRVEPADRERFVAWLAGSLRTAD